MSGNKLRRQLGSALILGALLAGAAEAGLDEWTSEGPFGGSILALAIDPQNPNILFAGTEGGGAYLSTDGGDHWSAAGDLRVDTEVRALAIDPQNPMTIYAATARRQVLRSTDGGNRWHAASGGLSGSLRLGTLTIDPQSPATLYATDRGAGIFKTSDSGNSWHAVNDGLASSNVLALAMDPVTPTTLYAGVFGPPDAGGGVYRSTDGGSHWQPINEGLDAFGVDSLAVDPENPATVYAGTGHGEVFKSADGGDHWQQVGQPSFYATVALAIDPETPTTLYAGTSDQIEGIDGGVYRSIDGGATWEELQGGLPRGVTRALVIDPSSPGTLYAGKTGGPGVFKSTDGGDCWSAVNLGLAQTTVTALAIDPEHPATLYAGTRDVTEFRGEIYRSLDGGGRWNAASNGLDRAGIGVLAVDPQTPTTLYAGGRWLQLSRSTDGGGHWSFVDGAPDSVLDLAIDPMSPTTLYAAAGSGGVHRSLDGGDSWSDASDGLEGGVQALAIDPTTPTTLYAGSWNGQVYRSADGGGHWDAASQGLPGSDIQVLAIDPANPSTLYAGTRGDGIYGSIDGGDNWSAVLDLPSAIYVEDLAIDPLTPTTLYAATWDEIDGGPWEGVIRSTDGGGNWHGIVQGLTHTFVNALAIDPATPSTLYAGTHSGGVFSLRQVGGRRTLWLHRGRFRLEVEWRDAAGRTGPGTVAVVRTETEEGAALRSRDSTVATFFAPDNWELLVKVLDGRDLNDRFWVFLAAATNVEVEVEVTDTVCDQIRTYANPLGVAAPAITDTRAFPGCQNPAPPSCLPGESTFCLGEDGRFQVDVTWRDFAGGTGGGREASLPRAGLAKSDDSGLFYFFSPENWELLVKVLDGCAINDRFWVFAAATTDVEYRLRVTDTESGRAREYDNLQGVAAPAVTDNRAFATCP